MNDRTIERLHSCDTQQEPGEALVQSMPTINIWCQFEFLWTVERGLFVIWRMGVWGMGVGILSRLFLVLPLVTSTIRRTKDYSTLVPGTCRLTSRDSKTTVTN